MSERTPCKSHIHGSRVYEPCRDGFPQTAACAGIVGATPACCNEELCGRLYDANGGKPKHPATPDAMLAASQQAAKEGE